MSPTRKHTAEKSAVSSARRFRHIRNESDRAVKTGSMVPNCDKNEFKRQIIIRFKIIKVMQRRNFFKLKPMYAWNLYTCMYMYMHLSSGLCSLFFFYLRMLIACMKHSKLYLKHKISINYDNQSGRIITHRTVQAHSQKHDEEEHCPQVGEGQFGQSLGVSNESQTGTYRAKRNKCLSLIAE